MIQTYFTQTKMIIDQSAVTRHKPDLTVCLGFCDLTLTRFNSTLIGHVATLTYAEIEVKEDELDGQHLVVPCQREQATGLGP